MWGTKKDEYEPVVKVLARRCGVERSLTSGARRGLEETFPAPPRPPWERVEGMGGRAGSLVSDIFLCGVGMC